MSTSKWVRENIKNKNFLAPNGFKLSLSIFPEVAFYSQTANLPGISINDISVPTPYRDYPVAGTETEYDDLIVKFLIDENLENYSSIHKWLRRTGLAFGPDTTDEPQTSRGLLQVLNSNFQANFTVEFDDLFPVSLTTLDFDSTITDVEYFTAVATFKYTIYRIKDKDGKVIS